MGKKILWTGLILWQGGALAAQFFGGFIPFVSPPGRVMGSWDMFAVPIARCDVHWQPAVQLNGRWVHALSELAAPLEWEIVFDTIADYREVAQLAVAAGADAAPPTHVRLCCVDVGGRHVEEAFDVR